MILRAAALAKKSHGEQKRKYTGRPYVEHPGRVAMQLCLLGEPVESVCAGWLHDVLEDTDCSKDEILEATNARVLQLVEELTNPSKQYPTLRREDRKKMDREHLMKVSFEAKIIKMVDRIDNLREMGDAPADFRRLYAGESVKLANAIGDVHPELRGELILLAVFLPGDKS